MICCGTSVATAAISHKGRGIFQLTGRANYQRMGQLLNLPLVDEPDLGAKPDVSLRIACTYWQKKSLNGYADSDDIVTITHRINGGERGLSERKRYYRLASAIWT